MFVLGNFWKCIEEAEISCWLQIIHSAGLNEGVFVKSTSLILPTILIYHYLQVVESGVVSWSWSGLLAPLDLSVLAWLVCLLGLNAWTALHFHYLLSISCARENPWFCRIYHSAPLLHRDIIIMHPYYIMHSSNYIACSPYHIAQFPYCTEKHCSSGMIHKSLLWMHASVLQTKCSKKEICQDFCVY